VTQQVRALATTIALSASPNPAFFTQNVTFTASVATNGSANVPTSGTVTFTLDNATAAIVAVNSVGQASFSLVFDTAGNHTVVAPSSGAQGSTGSTSPQLVESVNGNPIIVAVPPSVRSGDVFTVSVTLLKAGTTQPDSSFFGPVTLALNTGPAGNTFTTLM